MTCRPCPWRALVPVLLAVAWIGWGLAAPESAGDDGAERPLESVLFPGEEELAALYERDPTQKNAKALAGMRSAYALRFAHRARETGDSRYMEMAAAYAESATELAPDVDTHHVLLARLMLDARHSPGAQAAGETACEQALAANPECVDARLLLGVAQMNQDRPREAMGNFEYVLLKHPEKVTPQVVTLLTQAYVLEHELGRGADVLDRYLTAHPDADAVRLGRAILLHKAGARDEALAEVAVVQQRSGANPGLRDYARVLRTSLDREAKGGAR